jgi:hypothetical protein
MHSLIEDLFVNNKSSIQHISYMRNYPSISSNSIYRLSVKIVGSDAEIPIGVAEFHTY